MKTYTCSFLTAALCALWVPGAAAQLWDNGPLVTHPGGGPGGVDVSMASSVPNATGSNVTATTWRADDFSNAVPWVVTSIDMYAYDTNFPAPRWTSAEIQIRRGAPDGPLVSSAAATWQLAGINRVFNGAGNLANTARGVNVLTADFGGVNLSPDTYFSTLSIVHSQTANSWFPYVMDINPANPDDPITRVGDSMVSTDSGASWTPGTVTTGGWNMSPEVPFRVYGQVVPEPASWVSLVLLVCGCRLTTVRQR